MTEYLLDTNICIFFFKGRYNLDEKIKKVGLENCFISEITLAELIYGAEHSADPQKHWKKVNEFQKGIQVLPIFNVLKTYGKEKSRLRKLGQLIDDFDLLIGATAIENDLILVTNNTRHFSRIENIQLEDWTKS
ncbi:MAG: type II toxin-antitoxin system VapC family toxin [Bacteroidetes bacterium]|nr:type II toxin-antitoxin system VapC family toxin [Bacteroidota bacterium]